MKRLPLFLLLGFVAPPLLVGAATAAWRFANLRIEPAPAFSAALPAPRILPAGRTGRHSAVILAGNNGTEGSDFLAPYDILARSGAFDIYVAAPERRLSPFMPATVDLMPEFTLAELGSLLPEGADLVVVPYIPDAASGIASADTAVVAWLRKNAGPRTLVLSICGGSAVVARAGLLDGRRATSHHDILAQLRDSAPAVHWVRNQRYVDDGNMVSSGAILSGVDATLHVVRRLAGRHVAERVARELAYPHLHFLDDPMYHPQPAPALGAILNLAYLWSKPAIALEVTDGMDEVALAAIIDVFPRSFSTDLVAVGAERRFYRSRHGLALVPRYDRVGAPAAVRTYALDSTATIDGRFAFDASLADLSRHEGRHVTVMAARGLGFPVDVSSLDGPGIKASVAARPLLLGIAGVVLVWLAVAARRSPRFTPAAARAAGAAS